MRLKKLHRTRLTWHCVRSGPEQPAAHWRLQHCVEPGP